MCARTDHTDPREQAMARLLADALKPEASSGGSCPDAELVAAYADHGPLGNNERAQLEEHFSGCARCQRTLAALGVALETPAGQSVAPAPRAAARPSVQRWLWWLSPAFGAAAAALLWMALRPAAPEPVQTAANYSAAAEQETRAPKLPPPQAAAEAPPAAVARRDAQSLDRLSKTESAEIAAEAKVPEQAGAQRAVAQADSVPAAPPPAPPERPEVAALPQAPAVQAMARSTPPARDQAVAASEQTAAVQPPAAGTIGGAVASQGIAVAPAASAELAQLNLYTFSSPGGAVSWRLGPSGLIERSTDQGRTWQAQSSGVTNDLIAGSASSADVAWVVGQGRVILRTTDGEHWEQIAAPPGVTSEWVAVAVHGAMIATVVADDMRSFATEDGGRTWSLLP